MDLTGLAPLPRAPALPNIRIGAVSSEVKEQGRLDYLAQCLEVPETGSELDGLAGLVPPEDDYAGLGSPVDGE